MKDDSFKEYILPSFDRSFKVRLFKLPDEDGQVRLSFEILNKGTIYQLPKEYWLGGRDQIGWSAKTNILFFTTNEARKAFIYDVTFMTQVHCDLQPDDSVKWDEENKSWSIFKTEISPIEQKSDYRTNSCLKLSYVSDASDPDITVIPTPNERYVLVISRLKKEKKFEPDLWKMGIVDIVKLRWVVEELPYHIMGKDAVRFNDNHYMECYGFDAQHTGCCLFRFNCNDIPEQDQLNVFVNDFFDKHPEKVIWDEENQTWRAVINGEVIYPRPFYYDNMYSEALEIVSTPVPTSVLELVPQNEKLKARIEELQEQKKRQLEADYEQSNTPAAEIFSRMDSQPKIKRNKFKEPKKSRRVPKRQGKRSFMESPMAIVLSIMVLVIMIVGFIFAVSSGVEVGPVAAKNLFSAIAIVVMFLIGVIVRRRSDKYGVNFVLPDFQRSLMGISSIFIFISILIVFAMVLDHFPMKFHWYVDAFAPSIALLLIMYGVKNRRKAKTNKQYNIGCWLQWLSIWVIMLFVMSLLKTIDP